MPETHICKYYPPWFRRILDFQALCHTEGEELRAMTGAMDQIHQNLFIQTMDDGTAAQWEAILRILPEPGDTLEFRRLRVLNRLALRPPFTLPFLKEKLAELFGPENYGVEVDYPNYALWIELFLKNADAFANINIFKDILGIIKPCHILYNSVIVAPEMEDTLYITPHLGRCISITHLPELVRQEKQQEETLL
ncbi:MAG: DUF2313 domain-containing protein [Oscillospiraceae bacterium]|jgi:hypothetical protein|nr:DUF2313 domain-containing protein [Oscillospiraceae bacterium]